MPFTRKNQKCSLRCNGQHVGLLPPLRWITCWGFQPENVQGIVCFEGHVVHRGLQLICVLCAGGCAGAVPSRNFNSVCVGPEKSSKGWQSPTEPRAISLAEYAPQGVSPTRNTQTMLCRHASADHFGTLGHLQILREACLALVLAPFPEASV